MIVTQQDEEFALMEGTYVKVKDFMRISTLDICKNKASRKQTLHLKLLHQVQPIDVYVHIEV